MREPNAGRLTDNITYFARILRDAGLPVGPARVIEAVRAVEISEIGSREDFFWTLHAVFVSRKEQSIIFMEGFELFWRPRGLVEKMLQMLSPVAPAHSEPEKPKAGATRIRNAMSSPEQQMSSLKRPVLEIDAEFTVSGNELLQSKDFAQMTAAEIAEAKIALARMIMPQDAIKTRRLVPNPKGARLDSRRTLRASLQNGADIIDIRLRERKWVTPPIVALCDISGSMTQYSRLFLHFLHALTEKRRNVYSFLFGTRLSNVSRHLTKKDPDEALIACTENVADWSGGTRIATALNYFNRKWSRRVLGQSPTVLLITDGLERDSQEDLSHEIDRLHRSCRRLIWLNPLLRFDGFEAKAAGIKAMLPHVDDFRPVHNLASVSDLCLALGEQKRVLPVVGNQRKLQFPAH